MHRPRVIALLLAFSTGALTGWLVLGMARTMGEFHEREPRHIFAFLRVLERSSTFRGREVRFVDDRSIPGTPYLDVHYGDAVQRLRVTIPGNEHLPDLLPHEDWMRVLLFAPMSGVTIDEFRDGVASGTIDARMVVVTRTPRAGLDPKTWGAIMKKDWVFDFYELLPEGGFSHERLKYPSRGGVREPREGELRENTWQFQAALQLMPNAGGTGPTHNFFGNALAAAGWRLPASAFSGLVCTVALAFAVGPRRRAGWSWRTPKAGVS